MNRFEQEEKIQEGLLPEPPILFFSNDNSHKKGKSVKPTLIIALLVIFIFINCQITPSMKVVQLPVESDSTVCFRFWFRAGSQNDPPGKAGLASITSEMLLHRSIQKSAHNASLQKYFEDETNYTVQIDKEMTIFRAQVNTEYSYEFYQLFKDEILNPTFTEEKLALVKQKVILSLAQALQISTDEELCKATLYQFIFKGTNYETANAGLVETLESITLENVQQFYQTHFTRDNLIVGVGGQYSLNLVRHIKSDFNNLPSGTNIAPDLPNFNPINGLEIILIEKNTKFTTISLGFPLHVLRGSRDYYALWLANFWFAQQGGQTGKPNDNLPIRYNSRIEFSPGPQNTWFPHCNVARRQQIFEMRIQPVPFDRSQFVLRAGLHALKQFVRNGLSQEQFELARNLIETNYSELMFSTNARLGYQLDDIFYGVSTNFLDSFKDEIDKLTLEDVNQAVKKHLQSENIKIAIFTEDAKSFRQMLMQNKPGPIESSSSKPANVEKVEQEIAEFELSVEPENVWIIPGENMFVSYLK